MSDDFETGFFAGEQARGNDIKVHVVERTSKRPLCGARLKPGGSFVSRFQWCSRGIHLTYVNCLRCKRRVQTMQAPAPAGADKDKHWLAQLKTERARAEAIRERVAQKQRRASERYLRLALSLRDRIKHLTNQITSIEASLAPRRKKRRRIV